MASTVLPQKPRKPVCSIQNISFEGVSNWMQEKLGVNYFMILSEGLMLKPTNSHGEIPLMWAFLIDS